MKSLSLDIVVIGRNEAEFLYDSLTSAIKAMQYFQQAGYCCSEPIYVDGQSSDQSGEIAGSLGIKVIKVPYAPNPAKGRYMGALAGKAKYVLFLDGDTFLDKEWPVYGCRYLEKNRGAAGVGGILDYEIWRNGKLIRRQPNYRGVRYDGQKVFDGVGGNFLYRRDVLEAVGGFNPEISYNEEFELYLRIANVGYSLRRLRIHMGVHRNNKVVSVHSFLQRNIFSKTIFIPGIITRRSPKSLPTFVLLFYRYGLYLLHPFIMLSIIFFLFQYFYIHSAIYIFVDVFLIALLFLIHFFYKHRNYKRAFFSIFTMNFYSFGWFCGLFMDCVQRK